MTPAAVEERVRPHARRSTPTTPRCAAIRATTCPSIPGVGEKTAAKWIREFGSLTALVDRVDEVPGKAGNVLREHLASVVLQPAAHRTGARRAAARRPARPASRPMGPRGSAPRLRHACSSGCCATGSTPRWRRPSRKPRPGSRSTAVNSVPTRSRPGSHEHTSSGVRVGVSVTGTWGRGAGVVTGVALAAPDGAGAYLDPTQLTQSDDAALAGWLADAARPKAMHDAKGPLLALAARGWALRGMTSDTALAAYLALPGQRSFDLADLALRYLRRELRAERRRRRPGSALARRPRRGRPRARADRPGARGARSRRRA